MIEEIKAVLRYYADAGQYEFATDPWEKFSYPIMEDKGKRASELLKRLEEINA